MIFAGKQSEDGRSFWGAAFARRHADLSQDFDRQDHHIGRDTVDNVKAKIQDEGISSASFSLESS